MEQERDFRDIGGELGYEGVEQLVTQVEQICGHHRRVIELTNEPKIVELRAELASWADEDKRLGERLRLAPPPGDRRSRHLRACFAGAVGFILAVAGFFLSLLALDPFRFGAKAYLLCIGIALVCPYCVEKCLEEWDCHKLVKGLATIACIAAVTSLVLLAEIRGKLFAQEFADTQSEVVIDGASSNVPQNGIRFYEEAVPLLQLMMAFLALAMEVGSGLAFYDAKSLGIDSSEDWEQITNQQAAVRQRMASLLGRVAQCENEGAAFEARFWGNFYRAIVTRTVRKALGRLLVVGLCCAFVGARTLKADETRLNLVVLIDLSASVATKGPDGKTDFQKNIAAVTELLGRVPAGTKLTVLGITGNSFQEPEILLSAEVPEDEGYFGERLAAAHRQLVHAWQKRSAQLAANTNQTDILGTLLQAGQIFATTRNSTRKILIIYSDMRQATQELNLEKTDPIDSASEVRKCQNEGLMARLESVDVYALGVDAKFDTPLEWERLEQFWARYLQRVGSKLAAYSVFRPAPAISEDGHRRGT